MNQVSPASNPEALQEYSREPGNEAAHLSLVPELGRLSGLEIHLIPHEKAFYNAAAWEGPAGTTYLLGRQVEAAAEPDKPDVGSLLLMTLDADGEVLSTNEVWQPDDDSDSLEDVRVLPLSDGRLVAGLTRVLKEGEEYIPYPAFLVFPGAGLTPETFADPEIIKSLGAGADTTPVDERFEAVSGKNATAIDEFTFMFRQDGDDHRLTVFETDGETATKLQYIDFPEDIPWARFRVGTTIPPLWLNESQAIMPIHGITMEGDTYVYSIGSARLLRDETGRLSIDNISQDPLIDPDMFAGMFDGDDIELHADRRVVYSCGGIPVFDEAGELEKLKLYVNVGDTRTVEVTLPAAKLMENWQ